MGTQIIRTSKAGFTLRMAEPADIPIILGLIRDLADFERLLDTVVVTDDRLQKTLFGEKPYAEVVIGEFSANDDTPVAAGMALFFHNYSTFLGQPGIYLEDLYVRPEFQGMGFGKILLSFIATLALERGCGRFEWSVLKWNASAIGFYKKIGATPMDEWAVQRVTGDALENLARSFSQE